jgi:molybdate transport system substrate-binding protein
VRLKSKYKAWRSLGVAFLFLASAGASAQDIKIMISGGFSAAYKLLAPQWESSSGVHLETVSGPSMGTTPGAIPVRLARGEPADVVIMVRSALDELARKGEIVEGSQVDLAQSRIGMAVRAGATAPDISSVAALRQALLQARSVAYSDSASGVYIASELFKRLDIDKEMAAKTRQIPAEPVGFVVARGEAEVGFQQMSELLPIPGITIVGPIPDEVQKITVFSAGIVAKSKHQDAGRSLIRYLSSADVCATIKQTALDPAACHSGSTLPGHTSNSSTQTRDPLGQMHNPYGESVSLADAHKAASLSVAEARKNNWTMAVAITDISGELIYFEKMDGTQTASVPIAIDKARSAVLFRRPTKAFEDALTAGGDGLRVLGLRGAVPLEGGIPLLVDGKIVGAIGVSGGTNKQDGQCARAGAAALK